MVPVKEAVSRILEGLKATGTERIPLGDGLNRILAADVIATIDLPPFNHATVDGFAIHHQDVQKASGGEAVPLRVVDTILAGSVTRKAVKPGISIRVMTGTPLPRGTHAVVKEEDISPAVNRTDLIQLHKPLTPRENVASAGADVKRGEVVLEKGTTLRSEGIGILASLGLRQVTVFRQPRVALLSTGSELVDMNDRLKPGKIFASSFYLLLAKLQESGCIPMSLGIVEDDTKAIENRIRSARDADAIITV